MKVLVKNNSILFVCAIIFLSCKFAKKDIDEKAQTTESVAVSKSEKRQFIEIEGLGPTGDTVKFANIKAKYILVEFWASWCPPCRQFNPRLVSLYSKYQSKGFEVLSISLDTDANKWQNAIAKDGLIWPNHLSDLGGWDSYWAVKYGVESIPDNFLVDPNGKVIASSMSHEQLETTLANLFK